MTSENDESQKELLSTQGSYFIKPDKCESFFQFIDIFKFWPVPKADPISTSRSLCGSLSIIIFMFVVMVITFYEFMLQNIPKTNDYLVELDLDDELEIPPFAFAFVTGTEFNISYQDELYFNLSFQQGIIPLDMDNSSIYIECGGHICEPEEVDWLPNSTSQKTLICPNKKMYTKGILQASLEHKQPRMQMILCNESQRKCANKSEIDKLLQQTRIWMFINKGPQYNFATRQVQTGEAYQSLQYLPVVGYYQGSEIIITRSETVVRPDYFLRQRLSATSHISFDSEKTQFGKSENPLWTFFWFIRLNTEVHVIEHSYQTSFELLGFWGALFSVFYLLFSLYFFKFNKRVFYAMHPEWEEFQVELIEIRKKI